MLHPEYPNGAAAGLLVKDYRGKDANQVIWKSDSALEARIADDLKQAAIEEGQWNEKRDVIGCRRPRRDEGQDQPRSRPLGRREGRGAGEGRRVAAKHLRRGAAAKLARPAFCKTPPPYPKTIAHPGIPYGPATGLLVKDWAARPRPFFLPRVGRDEKRMW